MNDTNKEPTQLTIEDIENDVEQILFDASLEADEPTFDLMQRYFDAILNGARMVPDQENGTVHFVYDDSE